MNAFLLCAVRTAPEPRNAPTFPRLLTHQIDKGLSTEEELYRWMVDKLSQGYELGLYSGMHVDFDGEGDERVCYREEMLLWDGAVVLNRNTRVFETEFV